MGPVERAQQLGRFGAGRLAPGTGATAGMCSAGPRESLHLVRLSLGLPGTNQPALGRQKGSLRPGSPGPGVEFQDLEWYLPPRLPSPVLPQLLRRPPSPPREGIVCTASASPTAAAQQVLTLGGPGALLRESVSWRVSHQEPKLQWVAVGLQGSGHGRKEGPRSLLAGSHGS